MWYCRESMLLRELRHLALFRRRVPGAPRLQSCAGASWTAVDPRAYYRPTKKPLATHWHVNSPPTQDALCDMLQPTSPSPMGTTNSYHVTLGQQVRARRGESQLRRLRHQGLRRFDDMFGQSGYVGLLSMPLVCTWEDFL